jgi:hypothetical protein
MDRPLIAFGFFVLLIGIGIGYLILAFPEGLNPEYPLAVALIVPLAAALGGMHMMAAGAGRPAIARHTIQAVALCLLAVVNWAAFFTTHVNCSQSLSFLGLTLFTRTPDGTECLGSLRAIMAGIDALILVPAAIWAWQRQRRKP